jgi:hypothetical protein
MGEAVVVGCDHTDTDTMSADSDPTVFQSDCQCARCGSSCGWDDCYGCGGEGAYLCDDDECPDDWDWCPECRGKGGWWNCLSSREWCEAHPRAGREDVSRGAVEWFDVLSDGTTRVVAL